MRVTQMLGTNALAVGRTLEEPVNVRPGCLATASVGAWQLVTLTHTGACALLENALSTESVAHQLNVPKPQLLCAADSFHAAWVLVKTTIALAVQTSVLSRVNVFPIPQSHWRQMFRPSSPWRDSTCSVLTFSAPACLLQVSP